MCCVLGDVARDVNSFAADRRCLGDPPVRPPSGQEGARLSKENDRMGPLLSAVSLTTVLLKSEAHDLGILLLSVMNLCFCHTTIHMLLLSL